MRSEEVEELERALIDARTRADRAERALRDVREMGAAGGGPFHSLIAYALDVITIIDDEGRVTFVSPAVEELIGFRCGELVGTALVDLVHDDDQDQVRAALLATRQNGPSHLVRVTMRLRGRDGGLVTCEAVARNLRHDPDVRGLAITIRGRDESVSLRAELRHADMRADLAMRASGHGLWEWDAASGLVFWARTRELLGYDADELTTATDLLLRVIHPEDRARVLLSASEHLTEGTPFEAEARLRTKRGDWRWTRSVGQVQRNLRGEPTRIVGYTADIHERKLAELAVLESERLLRALFDSMPTAVTLRDMTNWRLVDCNPAAIRLSGCSSREELDTLVPSRIATEVQPDGRTSREVWAEVVREAAEKGTCRAEVWTARANGERYLAEVRISVVDRGGGRVLLALTDDVTERRMAEASLRDRVRRTALLSRISQRFVSNDTVGAVDAARADLDEWVERETGPNDSADDDFVRSIEALIALGGARARAEADLRVSEERYRSLVERSRDAVFTFDLERRVLFASPAAHDIFGFTPEELVSDPNAGKWVMQRVDRVALPTAEARERAGAGHELSGTTEWECVHKDGHRVFTEVVLSSILDSGGVLVGFQALSRDITERRAAREALARHAARERLLAAVARAFLDDALEVATSSTLELVGRAFDAEQVSLVTPDVSDAAVQRTHTWVEAGVVPAPVDTSAPLPKDGWHIAPVGRDGDQAAFLAVKRAARRALGAEDATTLHAAAELIAVGRLRRAAEVALAKATDDAIVASRTKSAFLARMSHELRTPLNGVIGMVDLLGKTRLDPRQQRYTEVARASAKLLRSVIDDILDFSKIEAGKIELVSEEIDVADLVEESVAVVALYAEEKGLSLSYSTTPAVAPPLVGDPARVRQLLVNLIGNAVKFTARGEVTVEANATDEGDGHSRVRVEVRDTGVGISESNRGRLFQPFSQIEAASTREQGGTGLGLAISRELVERMGGRIGVESEPGAGSTFWFEIVLPWAAHDATDVTTGLVGSHVRVLVVEGDAADRAAIVRHVTASGMTGDEAPDADAGFQLLLERSSDSSYHVVVAERGAALDGRPSLVERIRSDPRTSKVAVVVVDSLAAAADDELRVPPGVGYATKPLGGGQLVRALRDVARRRERHDESASSSVSSPLTRRTILVVEDNAINAEVASEILRSGGYDLDIATTGAEAIAAVKRRRYDLVLMDCHLPELDGFEAATRIRALEASGSLPGRRIPIVALTARATSDDLERCAAAGMDGHVAKPVDGHVLLRVIAAHMARRPSNEIADLDAARARVLGNAELLRRIARKFVDEAGLARDAIRRAQAAGDDTALAFAAHRLRGQSAAFAAQPLVAALEALEDGARSENHPPLDPEIVRVETELHRLLAFLRAGLLGVAPS